MLKRVVLRPEVPRGVWLHGGVGRGKSFLMDCFFEAVAIRRKARLHFHEFMRGVHRELRDLRSVKDPLDEVARRVARRYRLICFDEFHLSDIADAMILERLLQRLFGNGVVFVMTSNYAPGRPLSRRPAPRKRPAGHRAAQERARRGERRRRHRLPAADHAAACRPT